MIALLVVLFVLSGVAGLIYESIWSRYLGLFVGHTAYAQIVVLVIFMGGMAAGALLVGRRGEKIREPLLWYALVEAAVGALGFLFHPLFVAATDLAYEQWFPALAHTPALPIVKWSLSGALILPQSVLLGATFPLMTAGVLRRAPRAPGRMLGLFYFANSFGAAIGVLLSGFFLIGAVGLPGTVATAATLNVLVAAAVLIALRRAPAAKPMTSAPAGEEPSPALVSKTEPRGKQGRRGRAADSARAARESMPSGPALTRLLLLVSFGTAVASFVYEIGWIRMLSLVLGSAARSFELMLSAFILGLALGALWVRARADRFAHPIRTLGILQWAMGSLAIATLPLYMASFYWMSDLILGTGPTPTGYRLFTLVRYGICLVVMLPATFCAGTTLPLITRSLMAGGTGERAIGQVYGVNTLGAILGAILAGLVLLPVLGLRGLIIAGACVDVALGVALLALDARARGVSPRLAGGAALSTAALAAAALLFVPFEKRLLTSGVYRSGQLADPGSTHIMFYRDGRTASISVERYDVIQTQTISTNGKGDASMRLQWLRPEAERPRTVFEEDESTQVMTALLGLAHAPAASSAAVIGQGSGQTSHVMLGSSRLKELVTIEIEPAMIEGSRWFMPANRRVFEDPRSRLVVDDAKSYFAASQRRFDLILSEPSHPWVSGVSGLFSDEFYHRVKRHIAPGGVFCQWLELYEINDDLVLSVMAAIQKNFRHYELFMMDAADMFIVATDRSDGLKPDWSVVHEPGIATDLRPLPPFTPDLFEAMRIGSERTIGPLVRQARPNSDFRPVLDLGAERARFLGQQAEGFLHLHGARFSLSLLQDRRRVAPTASFAVPTPAIPRIGALAVSAALRTNPFPATIDPRAVDEQLPAAMEHRNQLARSLTSNTPPPDWRTWTLGALQAEDEWHGGSLGSVDERLHGLIRDYLAREHAPQEALQTFAFVHDMAAWDFARAAAEVDPLIERAARGEDWIPPETLLDGAFAARYLTGDPAGARRVLERLGPRIRDEGERTVMRLMSADLSVKR